jgi:outer membrane protein OmpA-like peptidoglycan-associated protein
MKFLITFIAVIFISANSYSQILPKKALERKATKIIEKKINEAPEEAEKKDSEEANKVQQKDEEAEVTKEEPEAEAPTTATSPLETYSKFDFIAGEKVIFYDDFSQDNVGDFPALWNTNGSAEVVTTNLFPGKWMKFSTRDAIWTDALLDLPDNYTIEFDIVPTKGEEGGMAGYNFRLIQAINPRTVDHGAVPGNAGFLFSCEYFGRTGYRTYINSEEGEDLGLSGFKEGKQYYQSENKKYHISIWVQKARIRLYQDQNKLFDLPKAFPLASVKMDRIRFDDGAAMVSNIRIAVGSPDMRSKLITEGKLVSYGIYFDVNKDVVKPESYGTLKEIANVLSENPDVKIKIVGHTDADGSNDANLDLSKRRAASVKNELVKSFGIGAERIETDGSGESQPVAANDTPANKALNRRVEFLKLK